MRRGTPIALSVNDNMTASGRRLICEWQNVPLREPGGEVTGILCMAQDVTERRLAMDREREAEERFGALVALSPQAIVVVDATGRVTVWNEAAEALTGWSAREVLGREVPTELTLAADDMRRWVAEVMAGATLEHVTTKTRNRQGHPIRMAVRGTPLRDAQGVYSGALFVASDVAGLDQLRNELHALETIYHAVTDTWEMPVCHFDTDLRMTYANQAAAALLGRSQQALKGISGLDVVRADQHDVVMSTVAKVLSGQEVTVEGGDHARPDGKPVRCEWTIRALRDCEGVVVAMHAVGRPLTPLPD